MQHTRLFVIWLLCASVWASAIDFPLYLKWDRRDLRNPIVRQTQYPILCGDTFRAFCDFQVDELSTEFDPTVVTRGSTVFVAMKYLKFFFEKIVPEIQSPFVLVTSNGDGQIDERYLSYIEHEKIAKWFGRNITIEHPKVCCIPLGLTWLSRIPGEQIKPYFSDLTREKFFAEKPIYCYLNIRRTHPHRDKVLEIFADKPFCKTASFMPFDEYMVEVASSRFVLSPRGFNLDSFRTWEALYAGSIPVIDVKEIRGVYDGLPVILVEDWNLVTPEFLEAEFEKLKSQTFHLERLHAQYWLDQIQEAKNISQK